MGSYTAHCMAGSQEAELGFNFELFTHVTQFLGKKVVLLGQYNGQQVPDQDSQDLISYSRSTEVRTWRALALPRLPLFFMSVRWHGETGKDCCCFFRNLLSDIKP